MPDIAEGSFVPGGGVSAVPSPGWIAQDLPDPAPEDWAKTGRWALDKALSMAHVDQENSPLASAPQTVDLDAVMTVATRLRDFVFSPVSGRPGSPPGTD